jgi:hypothetical protein
MSLNDAPAGRDARGRFAEGNPGGPGNPYTRQTAQLRQAVLETMNEAEIRLIAKRLLTLALQGDLQAIKLVLAYAIGKPEGVVNPDEVGRLEWELRQRLCVPLHQVETVTDRVSAGQANAVVEATREAVALQRGQELLLRLQKRGLLPDAMRPAPGNGKRPEVRDGHKGAAGARR